jgi:hypothetical protein
MYSFSRYESRFLLRQLYRCVQSNEEVHVGASLASIRLSERVQRSLRSQPEVEVLRINILLCVRVLHIHSLHIAVQVRPCNL